MSATDELRRMLDERGVEYFKHEDGEPLRKLEKADEPATSWHMGGASVCAVPIEGSDLFDLWIDHCAPEQAIAATLGGEREKALESMLEAARDDHRRFIDNMNEMIEEEVRERLYESSELTALTAEQVREDNSCAECAEDMGRYADSLCDPLKQRIAELEEQRDVLLRCLENDYGIKASWDGLRKLWLTESVTSELDYFEDKSRWYELFGTPERAARTLRRFCADCFYGDCATCGVPEWANYTRDYDALLEWLKGADDGE